MPTLENSARGNLSFDKQTRNSIEDKGQDRTI